MRPDRPHVSICVPSTGMWKAEMGRSLAHLCAVSIQFCDVGVLNGEHSSPASGRNRMVLAVLRNAPTVEHLLFVDTDMVFPADGLQRLLKHDVDMVGAAYIRRAPPHDLMGRTWEPLDMLQAPHGLRRAIEVPTGFVLIKRSVFRRVTPPWFVETFEPDKATEQNPAGVTSEDMFFCRRVAQANIKMFIDFDLTFEIGHIGDQTCRLLRPESAKLAS